MTSIAGDVEFIVWRIWQQALDEAEPLYYERLAVMYERMPCPRNDMIAQNCRRHARLLRDLYAGPRPELSPEVLAVAAGVS